MQNNADETMVDFFDLPEEVLRYIFRLISPKELCFNLRRVNQRIKKYVDDYLHCVGVFALNGEWTADTKLIYIFKKEENGLGVFASYTDPRPMPKCDYDSFSDFLYSNRLLKIQLFPLQPSLTDINEPLLMGINFNAVPNQDLLFGNVAITLYRFDPAKYNWKLLKTKYTYCKGDVIACCPISDSTVLMFVESRIGFLELISLSLEEASTSFLNAPPGCGQSRLDMPEELESIEQISFINISKKNIIVISSGSFPGIIQGTISDNNRVIKWTSTQVEKMWMRNNPICFKLKDNIYIVGKSKNQCIHGHVFRSHYRYNPQRNVRLSSCTNICDGCDKYNYKERKFYPNVHHIPYALNKNPYVKIATDKDETFALLIFTFQTYGRALQATEKRLMFTEKEGFVENLNYSGSILGRHQLNYLDYSSFVQIDN